jgi:Trypsin-like peptidase domain
MCFKDIELGIGTAFFYLYEKNTYLITNWHNVTLREPETLKCKSKHAAIPDRLLIHTPSFFQHESGSQAIRWDNLTLPLYEDEGDTPTKAIWYEHPQHTHKVDVIAIPLSGLEDTSITAVNDPKLGLSKIRLSPGLDVFILGFPQGMSGGASFPIWKRGSIASEPSIDIDGLPKIYIDTATRQGMSGSPVYARVIGLWYPEDVESDNLNNAEIGQGTRFLGIYSGRIGNDTFLAQLGIVWKLSVIEEIIKSEIKGQSSFWI